MVESKQVWFDYTLTANDERNLAAFKRDKKIKKITRDGVEMHQKQAELTYVNDIPELIRRIRAARGLTEDMGLCWKMDDGKKSLKLMVQVLDRNQATPCSTNTIMMVAEVPNIQESFQSVHTILKIVKWNQYISNTDSNHTTFDNKMFAYLTSIATGNARHPSPLCDWSSADPDESCNLRTTETMREYFEKFKQGNVEPKDCGGLKWKPVWAVWKNIDSGNLVLTVDQLHANLGLVNGLYKGC